MKAKWSAVAAAGSLVLASLVLAPFAGSAKGIFAANSDKVDGIHASRTVKPGALLPLGKNGKLPASVVPTVNGPPGATGPVGATGLRGQRETPEPPVRPARQGQRATRAQLDRRGPRVSPVRLGRLWRRGFEARPR